jgi:flagellar basal body-associated protein FliL
MPSSSAVPSTPAAQAAAARLAGMAQPKAAPKAAEEALKTAGKKESKGDKQDSGQAKKKKPVKIIAAVLVLLVVGYVVKGKVLKPHYRPGEKVPAGKVVALSPVTTNLSDGHLAQVTVNLQLTAPANAKQVANDEPEMVATIVRYLGEQTYAGLLAPAGRQRMQVALLHAFQHELGTSEGAEQVSAVYLTGFVLQ